MKRSGQGRIDMAGQRFGSLVVLPEGETRKSPSGYSRYVWRCRCDCGGETMAARQSLLSGNTRSCGCLKDRISGERFRTHGRSKTRLYRIWSNMHTRCGNPAAAKYETYGGRGITVCERWNRFENFAADMGEPPSDKHTLDRIDVNGNYEPANCRWVTQSENCRNRRDNRMITARGKTLCVAEWSEITGMPVTTIKGRLRLGWDDERVIETPVDKNTGQYDRTAANEKRKKLSYAEKLASVLVVLKRGNGEPLIPDAVRLRGTKAILRHVQWDHIHPLALGGSNAFHNLQPLTADDHLDKTKRDVREVAKTKRLTKEQEEFRRRILDRAPGEKRRPVGKIKSRGFPKKQKRGFR